jgi:uncharacterized protein (DUF433 family)
MERPDFSLIGVGIYSPSEASRLTGATAQQVHRWLEGYGKGNRAYQPLWKSQLEGKVDGLYLGFQDLIQVRVARAFIAVGLSPQKVRAAIKLGSEILATNHPLSTVRFQTDGKSAIMNVLVEGEDDRLIDLFRDGQYLMRKVVEPSLKGIEFDETLAVRWRPLGVGNPIIIDPQRQFGQPIDDVSGVPVDTINKAVISEGSIEAAARALKLKPSSVRAANSFWNKMAA